MTEEIVFKYVRKVNEERERERLWKRQTSEPLQERCEVMTVVSSSDELPELALLLVMILSVNR